MRNPLTPFLDGDFSLDVFGLGLAVMKDKAIVYLGLQLGPFAIYLGVRWE